MVRDCTGNANPQLLPVTTAVNNLLDPNMRNTLSTSQHISEPTQHHLVAKCFRLEKRFSKEG